MAAPIAAVFKEFMNRRLTALEAMTRAPSD
jgi:hypothetical protein